MFVKVDYLTTMCQHPSQCRTIIWKSMFWRTTYIYPFDTQSLTSRITMTLISYPYYMLFPYTKLLFRFWFKRDNFLMLTSRLELNHVSFFNDISHISWLLLWKLVKRLLCGVTMRTRTNEWAAWTKMPISQRALYYERSYIIQNFLF